MINSQFRIGFSREEMDSWLWSHGQLIEIRVRWIGGNEAITEQIWKTSEDSFWSRSEDHQWSSGNPIAFSALTAVQVAALRHDAAQDEAVLTLPPSSTVKIIETFDRYQREMEANKNIRDQDTGELVISIFHDLAQHEGSCVEELGNSFAWDFTSRYAGVRLAAWFAWEDAIQHEDEFTWQACVLVAEVIADQKDAVRKINSITEKGIKS